MTNKLFRRDLLQNATGLFALTILGVGACNKEPPALSCADTSGLASADLALRTSPAVAYVDSSTQPGKTCSACLQFNTAGPRSCGTCKVLKGPINPGGYCNLFVAKPA
jgi:hypothetical protein